MVRTRVGYAGGTLENPTYHHLGDHTESFQIDFDPAKLSYADLLGLIWSSHNPCARSWSRQYMSAIFFHGEEQKRLAFESKAREEKRLGAAVHTPILPAGRFWLAEDYHQKYYLTNHEDLAKEFRRIYPDAKDFVASTAVARVNGYLGGDGTRAQLEKEIDGLGLSPEGRRRLLSIVR